MELLRAVIPTQKFLQLLQSGIKMNLKGKTPNLKLDMSRSLMLEPSLCLPGTTCRSAT